MCLPRLPTDKRGSYKKRISLAGLRHIMIGHVLDFIECCITGNDGWLEALKMFALHWMLRDAEIIHTPAAKTLYVWVDWAAHGEPPF